MPDMTTVNHNAFSEEQKDVFERLKEKSVEQNGCWLWQGAAAGSGHGRILYKNQLHGPHEISAELFLNHTIGSGINQINHKRECTNPNCWNPEHLYVGSRSQNYRDAEAAGKIMHGGWKTHCPYGHEYTPENTKLQKSKTGFKRKCRECDRRRKNKSGKKRNLVIGNHYASMKGK